MSASAFTLTASCTNQHGIVRAVTEFIDSHGYSITEHQQFDDDVEGRLFLRTAFAGEHPATPQALAQRFRTVADAFGMRFELVSASDRPRVAVLVSKEGHCLNDLVFRWSSGDLGAELAVVISNHELLRPMVESAGLPFVHIPVARGAKLDAERELRGALTEADVDLVVLARYMQVLSDGFCREYEGRVINIHHSFLPGFKGARPYHQAFERGVKYVGATAHYVTPQLDEGPIIEQEVARVTHAHTPADLARVGRSAEAVALSRAVQWHSEHRILLNGSRTVVFG